MREIIDENVRNVKVPLSVEEIKDFFVNKELLYFVNYSESELKDVVFLTYLSNLDLPAEINFDGTSYDDKEKLFVTYMKTRNIITCDTLRLNIANILLVNKGVDTSKIFSNLVFTDEETKTFIKNNEDVLNRWNTFIESSLLFAFSSIPELEEKLRIKENVEIVDDPLYVGTNVVNVFSIPGFMNVFFSTPFLADIKYFKPQYEDYMFRGKNFYSFFDCDENLPFQMMLANINNDITLSDILGATDAAESLIDNG